MNDIKEGSTRLADSNTHCDKNSRTGRQQRSDKVGRGPAPPRAHDGPCSPSARSHWKLDLDAEASGTRYTFSFSALIAPALPVNGVE